MNISIILWIWLSPYLLKFNVNKAQVFTEKRKSDDIPINLIENMYNQQREEQTDDRDPGFPSTPASVKLSDHKLLSNAFRVSFFVHDLLKESSTDEDQQSVDIEDFDVYPKFEYSNLSIFEEELQKDYF